MVLSKILSNFLQQSVSLDGIANQGIASNVFQNVSSHVSDEIESKLMSTTSKASIFSHNSLYANLSFDVMRTFEISVKKYKATTLSSSLCRGTYKESVVNKGYISHDNLSILEHANELYQMIKMSK